MAVYGISLGRMVRHEQRDQVLGGVYNRLFIRSIPSKYGISLIAIPTYSLPCHSTVFSS